MEVIMSETISRDQLLDKIEKAAHDYEREYHGCSRSVLKALQEHLELGGDENSVKAATPLAGGTAMRGETCGAVLGGMLAVGMETASDDMADEGALIKSLAAGFRLAKRVEKEFGTISCREIQTGRLGRYYNFADPKQYKDFIEAGGYRECPKVSGKIARIAAEIILYNREKARK
jgi:C_GCAxxG_C_C family probable redox protein